MGMSNEEWMAYSNPSTGAMDRYLMTLTPEDKVSADFARAVSNKYGTSGAFSVKAEDYVYAWRTGRKNADGTYTWDPIQMEYKYTEYTIVVNSSGEGYGVDRSFDNLEKLDMISHKVIGNLADYGVKLIHFKKSPKGVIKCGQDAWEYTNSHDALIIYRQVTFELEGKAMFFGDVDFDPNRVYFRTRLLDSSGKLSEDWSYFSFPSYIDGCDDGITW